MAVTVRTWDVGVSRRADGQPWPIRFVEVSGAKPGPTTAFVSGVFGDKPLGTIALWGLTRRLQEEGDLAGTVVLCPAANPPALEVGTRISPDHLFLNRVFPGSERGFLTNQIAHAVITEVLQHTDHVIDLHSGSPSMALWYTYDYGDLDLSASFGYLPIVTNFAQPGQLSKAVVDAGGRSALVEFGGGALGDPTIGIEGCLNVLRYRDQLGGRATGPARLPVVDGDVALYLPSEMGILSSRHATSEVGSRISPGVVAWLDACGTGERLDEFVVDRDGGLLMLANTSPTIVSPGAFGSAVAFPAREVDVPGA